KVTLRCFSPSYRRANPHRLCWLWGEREHAARFVIGQSPIEYAIQDLCQRKSDQPPFFFGVGQLLTMPPQADQWSDIGRFFLALVCSKDGVCCQQAHATRSGSAYNPQGANPSR